MSLKVQSLESGAEGFTATAVRAGREQTIPAEALELVDWEAAYLDLLEYKERKGLANLAIRPETLKQIVMRSKPTRLYSLVADDSIVNPKSFADVALLQEAVHSILKKYVDKFYRAEQERWELKNMVYKVIDDEDPNFQDYTVKIARSEAELISVVQKLIAEGERIYKEETTELPGIHFDRHLYQPLLVERGDKIKSVPPGLNDGERRFVEDMRRYCREEKDKSLADKEVFLLRNLSRGKGIGFFEKQGFYPDFILWIKSTEQRIVFIEPHGMLQAEAYIHDDKARLHERLPELSKAMGARAKRKNVNLDSFIVSATPYEDLRTKYDDGTWDRERFAKAHILFPERSKEYDYLAVIMGRKA